MLPRNPDATERETATNWHALSGAQALTTLNTQDLGLSAAEAARRLATHGPNTIARAGREGALALLWRQINNPLIWVLIGAGGLAIAMGKVIDGLVVLGVVVLNAVIGFVQEFRAGRAIEALAAMVPETTTVLRAGQRVAVDASDLVPGDIVALASGDKVPADLRLLEARTLQVNEAALTGESVPVEKTLGDLPPDTVLADRRNMLFGGTLVTSGAGLAVTVETGARTELGRISSMLTEVTHLDTPLTLALARIAKIITVAIVLVAAVLFFVGLGRGYAAADGLLVAITLAVGAIPEGLPAIFTIALAIGVQRMAARRAIIRRLPAVETLGSTTVICSDKTGTLTRNEMTVQSLVTSEGEWEVTGVGYRPVGELRRGGAVAAPTDDVRSLLTAGVLCNDAALSEEAGEWKLAGDPTEGALLAVAEKASLCVEELRRQMPRLDAIPFESDLQFMATLHREADGALSLLVKGAPEVVAARCDAWADGVSPEWVHDEVERLALRGMRVLGFARKRLDTAPESLDAQRDVRGLAFLGLQGMIDPPRPEAMEAIRVCHSAGITVKMITGDHRATAQAIGRELGLIPASQEAVTGATLATLSDDQLREVAAESNVFARVAPEHKLRLVQALQAQGHVVAMTGDGVNDAPALKQADIGVAMGITGTAVSKESADIILTDDNFASIAAAVEEGRRVYDNLIKALAFVLPTNLGLAFIILAAVAFLPIVGGTPLMPILPVQILWINLVATVALALPLAFEAMEPDVMRRPPRRRGEPVLSRFVVFRTLLVSLLMAAGAVGLFLYEHAEAKALGFTPQVAMAEAQTMAVTTVILFQIFYLLNCRSLRDSILKIGLFSNNTVYLGIAALLLLQGAFIYLPAMNSLFSSHALPAFEVLKAALVAATVLPIISLEKCLHVRRRAVAAAQAMPVSARL